MSRRAVRGQQEAARDHRKEQDHEEGREYSPHPAAVEIREGKAALGDLAKDQAGYQIAGDDEEDVHADVTAGEQSWKSVEKQYRQNSDTPVARISS